MVDQFSSQSIPKREKFLFLVTFPSGHTLRPRRICTKIISDAVIKEIGLTPYYEPVRKTFDTILKMLDTNVGRGFLVTRPDNNNKDSEDLLR